MKNNQNVKIIEGFDVIKAYYYSINNKLNKDEEVLVFGARSGNPNFQKAIDFFVNYIHDRSKKGIKTKILYNVDVQSLGRTYESIPLVKVRYMPMGLITKVGVNIYRDTIDMLNWDDPSKPRVVVIKDKQIADSYREYFNMMWSATVAISELEKKGNFWLPEILFEEFINHSNEKKKVEQTIVDIINRQKPTSLLNIGSGFDTISKSNKLFKGLKSITLVEKNTSYVQAYTDTQSEVVHVDFELWETENKYDIILASHILYYLKDKMAAVKKVINLLNPGGVALFIAHEPSRDYKKLKDFVFGFKGRKYVFTYNTLKEVLNKQNIFFNEIKIGCKVTAKTPDELYKALRLWFEMDLKTYYEHESQIKSMFSEKKVSYVNSIFIVRANPAKKNASKTSRIFLPKIFRRGRKTAN